MIRIVLKTVHINEGIYTYTWDVITLWVLCIPVFHWRSLLDRQVR